MKKISTFIVLYVVWLLLVSFSIQEVILGAIVSLVLTFVIDKVVMIKFDMLLPIRLLNFIVVYIPVFIWELIKANIDIAWRIIQVEIPLSPGIVKVDSKIKSDYGRLVLANSITLTPGTLTLEEDRNALYVHCVDVSDETSEEQQQKISGKFEKILGGIFK